MHSRIRCRRQYRVICFTCIITYKLASINNTQLTRYTRHRPATHSSSSLAEVSNSFSSIWRRGAAFGAINNTRPLSNVTKHKTRAHDVATTRNFRSSNISQILTKDGTVLDTTAHAPQHRVWCIFNSLRLFS